MGSPPALGMRLGSRVFVEREMVDGGGRRDRKPSVLGVPDNLERLPARDRPVTGGAGPSRSSEELAERGEMAAFIAQRNREDAARKRR
jgi:hypothetical protein